MAENGKSTISVSSYYIGLSITFLYIIFLALLFIGFSAYITRTAIDSSGPEAKSIDVLIYTNEQDLQLDENLSQIAHEISRIQRDRNEMPKKFMEIERDQFVENSRIHSVVSDKISKLIDVIGIEKDSNLRNFFKSELQAHATIDSQEFNEYTKIRHHLATFRVRAYGPNEDKELALKIASELSEELTKYGSKFKELDVKHIELLSEQNRLDYELEAAEQKLAKLEKMNSDALNNVTTRNKSIIASLELPADVLLRFVKMPTIILTLVVTIAAGGLGSLAAFTRKFVRQDAEAKSSRLFANVAEGIVASIAIFLFAGTGMLMLTQGGAGQETSVELSPYMVAFIAFLSGFMAESAFEKIEEAGRKFFKTDDPANGGGSNGGDSSNGSNQRSSDVGPLTDEHDATSRGALSPNPAGE